ncbi:hypothetical protein O4H53_25860 [Sulfitobacter sp. G21635-S1]|uniref:hypothetical protein n=1 Tax=Sulfitobacter sp. G21635-S1 TaxID=3014043 RepID=UPI0022AE6516|nr:hypothetical protein [Sulfitobacter sp. G21635-S1]MCZ4258980.1 hypothetical protein [Sulfitobacter sp. G21635-S1]
MTNEVVYPFNGKVGVVLNADASQAILKLGYYDGTLHLGLAPAQIDPIIRQLNKVAAAAEEQRRKSDPFAGTQSDTVMRSAFPVRQCAVGTAEGVEGIAITLHQGGAPNTYLLDYAQSEDLAQRILAVLRGQGPKAPPRQ